MDRTAYLSTGRISYRLYQGPISDCIVVMTALGACSAEWWHLAESWAKFYSVLLYDRSGYGLSEKTTRPRTPDSIAQELKELLDTLHISEIRLLGHSIGGLYAYQFARLYTETVRSLILLDPVSPDNDRLKEALTEEEYKQSGIEKEGNVKILKAVVSLGLSFLLKPILKKAPPFYYYSRFTEEAEKRILAHAVQKKTIVTMENEYSWLKDPVVMRQLKITRNSLPMPLTLILHTPENLVREIETYGHAPHETAEKVEKVWSGLMREYLIASDNSQEMQAVNSAHFIHLSDPESINKALQTK